MLGRLAPGGRNADAEQADIPQQIGDDCNCQSWDGHLHREGAASEVAVDVAAMRPYFEAKRVLRDGVFLFTQRPLYGITFAERPRPGRLPILMHRVVEVTNEDGLPLGL